VTSGLTSASKKRKRRRKTLLPTSVAILDYIAVALLSILPVGVIWVLGGNRFWIMGPVILVVLFASLLVLYRFFWSDTNYDFAIPPGGFALLGFVGYLALILPFAEIPYEAWQETFRYISYALAYWMWFNLLRINQRWKWVMMALLLSVSVMAWYALIQNVHGTAMVINLERPEQYGMRASGSYICPNHFANLLGMTIPLAVGIALTRGMTIPIRLVAAYTALVSLPALYLTESRSGYIGLLVGCVVLALSVSIRKGAKRFLTVLLVAPLLAAALGAAVWAASPKVQARVERALEGDIRISLWQDSLVMAKENALLGSGLGTYRWKFPSYRDAFASHTDPEFAHNDYLQFWSEIGIVGLLLMSMVVFYIMRRSFRVIRGGEGKSAFLVAGMLGSITGAYAHAFFDFNLQIFGNVHVLVFIVAGVMAVTYGKTVEQTKTFSTAQTKRIGVALAVLALSLTITYGRSVISYFNVLSAGEEVEKLKWENAQDKYETAIKWSPRNWKAHIGFAHLLRTKGFWSRDNEQKKALLDQARASYELVEKMNPWEGDVLYGLATVCRLEGDEEEALRYRKLTVEKVPKQPYFINELGLQLKRMGRYEEALEAFDYSLLIKSTPVARSNREWLRKKLAEK